MTESKWRNCSSPEHMLLFVQGKTTDRKLRLFFCACAHRVWGLFADPRSRHVVEVAERYADGLASADELAAAKAAAHAVAELPTPENDPSWHTAWLAVHAVSEHLPKTSILSASAIVAAKWANVLRDRLDWTSRGRAARTWERRLYRREQTSEADLLRDIIGPLPFRPARLDAAWLTGTVVRVAQAIYAERRWDEMPVLGDALSEAGCSDAEVLEHCRGKGPHTRGCWAVDLLLKKE